MELLNKDEIEIRPSEDGIHVVASFYKHLGYRSWALYHLSDFPNYLASAEDFKRLGINILNGKAGVCA